jgi:hypothetical protein
MATEDQQDLARYYQGLANDAKLNAESIARTEAVGLAEQARLQETLKSLQRQRETAILPADRARLDNSIQVQTANLNTNKSAVAQLQQQRNAALTQVTANQNLAEQAVGGPPAAQNIPGPASTPASPLPPPSIIPVTPAATPQPDFVNDPNTGEQVPSDSVQADEIRAGQNRVDSRSPAPVPGSTDSGVLDPQQQAALAIQNPTAEPADDPFEAARLAREAEGDGPTLEAPEPVNDFVRDPETGEQVPSDSVQAEQIRTEQAAAADRVAVTAPAPVPSGEWTAVLNDGTGPGNEGTWYIVNETGEIYQLNIVDGNEARIIAENLSLGSTEALPQGTAGGTGLTPEEQLAKDQAAAKAAAINQATRNSVYNKAGSSDWRVRLQLAPTSDYLYNANPSGILGPLAATNGVIFPYTPQINTSYRANYEQYDLVHSNYRGVYYKNSRVDDLNIRAEFTAQDTREADYLLAVIHFFRSVTKMFYGKDEQRGSPPPLVYLSGLGMNQFFGHPCVVTSFQYNLPNNVDYIRASSVNNYGTDLLSRRTATRSSGVAGLGASGNRILNAGLERFFPGTKPAPDSVVASVNNTQLANYVPTKMEIDIALIPVQTRSQVSKQFSLKGFANGDLIKGGFW